MAAPALLLLHGLGATPGVWAELIDELNWDGPVWAPALAGHGDAAWTGDYTVGSLAAGVSANYQPADAAEQVIVVGHSLGGGVATCLASGLFRPCVAGVAAIGVKVAWTDADVTGMAKVAAKGVRTFDSRDEAVERFLLQAGLAGLVDTTHPSVTDAVVEEDGAWRVAQDPATFAQRALDMPTLLAAARCPVILGAGTEDPIVTEADLAALTSNPRMAPGRGHNVQIEEPAWVAQLVRELADGSAD